MEEKNNIELRLSLIEQDLKNLRERSEEKDLYLREEIKRLADTYAADTKEIKAALDKATSQLGMYRHFVIFMRGLLASILIVLTLRFGDIKEVVLELLK